MAYDEIKAYRPRSGNEHPPTLHVWTDNRECVSQIPNPASYEEGGPAYIIDAASPFLPDASEIAGLIRSYEYLLSPDYTMADATKRLRDLRRAYRDALNQEPRS